MNNKIHLSVVIPAYDEEKRIAMTLLDIDRYLSKQEYTYEIIVVSDGSKDNTANVATKTGELIRNLRIIDNKENHGKGYVTKQAMLEAKGEYRLFMDADNSTKIDHLDLFWPEMENNDIVIGSIEIKGAKIHENAQWYRRWLGRIAKYIIRFVAGLWEIKDTQRGFKLFNEKSVLAIFPKQTLSRWGFDFEILALAKKMGFKIKEVAVDWYNPGESKVNISSYIKTFIELLKIKFNFITNKYGIKKQ
ncbi:MAG: glycosyltransferase family 2 protein [Nanoarchaeota archaeon]|nr:glycosyltransferase family 2 protein [Nanoarchaeota archaeon]